LGSARAMALSAPPLAYFCTATWPVLSPPLTIGEEYTMFNYAPFLLAGLLRWRIKNPTALVSGVDPLAADFLAIIEEVEADLVNRRRPSVNLQRRRDKILPILKDIKAELLGEGTNPDLLLDIYGAG
ncbi:hypothetical protein, partial [Roseovarius sp. MBR-6]|uniref:hypothetical protein n=1 Tax=Roseovarius sp. MBR-6 TaxID=3156459 RepID=UPI003391C0F6